MNIKNQIEKLRRTAETGEQWAHICALEAVAECEFCGGTGLRSVTIGGDGYGDRCCGTMDCDDQPCGFCNENYSVVQP
jgi:hypothetical protein